jgi:hypothetical protein
MATKAKHNPGAAAAATQRAGRTASVGGRPAPTPRIAVGTQPRRPGAQPAVPSVNPDVLLTRGRSIEDVETAQLDAAHKRAKLAGAAVGTKVKVRAKKTGYYNDNRFRQGDVFLVLAEDFSQKWMEHADPRARAQAKGTGPNAAIAREHDAIVGKVTRDTGPTGPADDDDVDE